MTIDPISSLCASTPAEFANSEFLLVGGTLADSIAAANAVAGSYAVFDATRLAKGAARAEAALGRIEILLYPRSLLIDGLSRMEIASERRQRGIGRRLIQSLAATTPEFELNIYDIRPASLDFWIALGCNFRRRPGGWEASYILPQNLRPHLPDSPRRVEALRQAL
jgi:hypothetical protein